MLTAPGYDVEDESDRDFWCELKGKKGYITLKQARVAKKKGDGARRAAQDLVQKYNSRRGGGDDDGDFSDIKVKKTLSLNLRH